MKRRTASIFLVLVCILVLSGCGSPSQSVETAAPPAATVEQATAAPSTQIPATPAEEANGQIARQHLVALSEEIGPRLAGSPEEAEAAQYIQSAFEEIGYETELQPFTFTQESGEEGQSANVIAVKTGLSPQEIVVGAHYDSVDDAEGADDNASGVAVMLEVAEKVRDVETPYTIRFVAFGSEEVDLDGSRYYVDQMDESDIQNTVGMINLDSLIAGDLLYVYGDAGPAGVIRDWILELAKGKGLEVATQPGDNLNNADGTPCDCADYGPFEAAGLPFAYFEATNWNLGDQDGMTQVDPQFGDGGEIRHTEYDTVSSIDQLFPGRIDHHLNVFVTLLYDTLTQFRLPE